MNAGQQGGLASDFANCVELAAVRTAAGIQDFVAEDFFLEAIEGSFGERDFFLVFFRNGFDELGFESVDEGVAFLFGMLLGVESILEVGGDGLL